MYVRIIDSTGRLIVEKRFEFYPIRIGRKGDNDLVVSDQGISRYHAVIEEKDGIVYIRDLDSANGISENQEKKKTIVLGDGKVVFIGKFQLFFDNKKEDGVSAPIGLVKPPIFSRQELEAGIWSSQIVWGVNGGVFALGIFAMLPAIFQNARTGSGVIEAIMSFAIMSLIISTLALIPFSIISKSSVGEFQIGRIYSFCLLGSLLYQLIAGVLNTFYFNSPEALYRYLLYVLVAIMLWFILEQIAQVVLQTREKVKLFSLSFSLLILVPWLAYSLTEKSRLTGFEWESTNYYIRLKHNDNKQSVENFLKNMDQSFRLLDKKRS